MAQVTTLNRFKIWAEGPKDVPAIQELAQKLPADASVNIVVQQIGGWANLLAPEFSAVGLADGCHDVVVLLDGDRARDWSKPGAPLQKGGEVARALKKLSDAGIDWHVLEAYALENYFPQKAFEAVLGVTHAGHFPLDRQKAVSGQLPEYRKSQNRLLASATELSDLTGTDLGRFLEDVEDRARIDS